MGSLARKFYYALPPGWRLVARWVRYLPQDVLDSLFSKSKKLVPPRRLIFTGAGDFLSMGDMFLKDFISKKIIHPQASVLDIGSGIGRIAIPLTRFLTAGKYEGFDIMAAGIQWCQKNITTQFPNFHFQKVALANDLYRNDGGSASQFVFPYPDNEFDLAIATSVFTHMLPEEVKQYVSEIHRVLKPAGKAYLTFFILNERSRKEMTENGNEFNFKYNHGHYRLLDEKVQSANVAFEEKYLFDQLIPEDQFITSSIEYGSWSTKEKMSPIAFQDRVVLMKK